MYKIHIVGNPNSGKTTLFNSLTKSSEHVGNWHGVTVNKTSKIIKFKNNQSNSNFNKRLEINLEYDNIQSTLLSSELQESLKNKECYEKSQNNKHLSEELRKLFKNKKFKNKNACNKDLNGESYEIVDLPGLYSLNAFSYEEQVSVDEILSPDCDNILYLMDANNFKRSMLLALDLLTHNKNIKILINNYKYFQKNGGSIDTAYLQKILGCEVEIINARKAKPTQDFFTFTTRETAFIKTLKQELMQCLTDDNKLVESNDENCDIKTKCNQKINDNKGCVKTSDVRDICKQIICNSDECCNNKLNDSEDDETKNQIKYQNVEIFYKYILKISNNCVKKENKIYGYSKFDKNILKLSVFLPIFILIMFFVIYFTFFLVGPVLTDFFLELLHYSIQKPIMAILNLATNSRFILALFEEGVFGACFSVLGFLPQICLMYLFLSILENSGLISRMAFLFDDMLQRVGLNGKMVYTMLMGFGCSTSALLTAKNMADKNSQIKASLLTPFMSCSAKLPIYTTVALAICGVNSVWLIFGLYLLGIAVAILLAIIFERTILPSRNTQFVIEFPPLKVPDLYSVWFSIKTSCKQFIVKVFGVIFGMSIVLWLLTNLNIKFQYVGDSSRSILYSFSMMISWAFKPIGLNNPNIICALLVGFVAKELILSSFAISNKVTNLALLSASLTLTTSAVNFNFASGVSFLVFTLLYFPCVANFGVLLKEIGVKYTLFGVTLQLVVAYIISYLIYTLLTKGLAFMLLAIIVITIIVLSIKLVYNKIKSKKIFCNCVGCDKCNK